jgi:hypothetical protein
VSTTCGNVEEPHISAQDVLKTFDSSLDQQINCRKFILNFFDAESKHMRDQAHMCGK